MDELEVTIKILIVAIFVEILVYTFAGLVGSSGISNPALSGFALQQSDLNASVQNFATSWNYTLLNPIPAQPGAWFDISSVYNASIAFPNVIAKIVNFFVSGAVMVGHGVTLVIYMTFVFLPTLLNNSFGPFGAIFAIVAAVIPVIIIVYALKLVTEFIGRFMGGSGSK